MKRDLLYPVQYLRAVAALAVCYFHLSMIVSESSQLQAQPIEKVGAAGVDLFFVISGFIMAKIAWSGEVSFSAFMRHRIIRLVPIYWLATFAVFAIAIFAPSLLGTTTADPLQLLHSLLFLPYGVSDNGSAAPVLAVGWTLNYEMFFYVLVAVFAGIFRDRTLIGVAVVIGLLAVVGYGTNPQNGYAKFYFDPIILEFAMGILVFHLWRKTAGRINMALACGLLVASVAMIIVLFQLENTSLRFLYWGGPTAILLFTALHVVTFKSEFLRRVGDWSYSIYLLHIFVIMAYHKIIAPAVFPQGLPWLAYVAIVLSSVIALSAISFHGFERPVGRWLKTLKRTSSVSGPKLEAS